MRLVPLTLEHHDALCRVGLDERLWQATTIRVTTPDEMRAYIESALRGQAEGTALPFVIVENGSGQIVGTTRYHAINMEHRRLEIGFTWIAVDWQRTGVNREAKYLMLRHAFETLGCLRVQFMAAAENTQSRRAIERLGAKEEGIIRSYVVSAHKGPCDAALYSILAHEWPQVERGLRRTEGGERRTENGGRRTEGGGRRAEGGGRKNSWW